ncbi:hypothetical protein [Kribbella sp. CA-294648]|uniref:hypothetical protein n=1 Tax=Kribbella sp. CA-294648 TaxID=3239948 RepID=UPI003D934724
MQANLAVLDENLGSRLSAADGYSSAIAILTSRVSSSHPALVSYRSHLERLVGEGRLMVTV